MEYILVLICLIVAAIVLLKKILPRNKQIMKEEQEEPLERTPDTTLEEAFARLNAIEENPFNDEYRPVYEGFVKGSVIELLVRAIREVAMEQEASVVAIQRAFGAENIYNQAGMYLDCLIDAGIVEESNTYGTITRKVVITEGQAEQIIIPQMQRYPKKWGKEEIVAQLKKEVSIMLSDFWTGIDTMSGLQFEEWCVELLEKLGYEKVETTKASGDQGVDILAERDEVPYAFQCKCYATVLGNTPIQEVYAGLRFYNCNVGVVITNRSFTSGAKDLAKATGVLLWDREKLKKLMKIAGMSVPETNI